MMPRVAIILVHYASLGNTRECLQSLKKVQYAGPLDIVVVDNAAREPATQLLQAFPEITLLTLTENTGFTGGNNAGIEAALKRGAEICILLNDDTTVDPQFVTELVALLERQPEAGAAVAKIYFSPQREYHHASYSAKDRGNVLWYAGGCLDWREVIAWHRGVDEVDQGQYDHSEQTPFATGCCVAYRAAALRDVGLLDNAYFLYFEDVDLSLRLRRAGWEIWYQPQAKIWHKNAGSSGAGSALHEYYQTRNRFRFGFRYAPLRTKLFLIKHAFQLLRSGSPAVKRAILDSLLGIYGKRQAYHTIHTH